MQSPALAARTISTDPSSVEPAAGTRPRRVDSTGTTASAPGGIGAPVMIRMAWPGESGDSPGPAPAAIVPTTTRSTGESGPAAAVSAAMTAKPSIAVLANGGTRSEEIASSASTSPCAWPTGTGSGLGAGHRSSTHWRASSRVSKASFGGFIDMPATLHSRNGDGMGRISTRTT